MGGVGGIEREREREKKRERKRGERDYNYLLAKGGNSNCTFP